MRHHDPQSPGFKEHQPIMMPTLLWTIPALVLLAAGWFASQWFHERKIKVLHAQIKALKHTAVEHANQARRQIGQLQTELAARPPMAPAIREQRANAAETAAAAAQARRAVAEALVPDDGFAVTAIARHGFAKTEVMA
jgi:hypothetical protein